MSIVSKEAIRRAYNQAAEMMPLADTGEVLEAVAALYGLTPEAVEEAIESEREAEC